MRRRSTLVALALTLVLLLNLAQVAPALAWSNGPDWGAGFGTHDWVLTEARRLAGNPSWLNSSAARAVTDDPDMVYRDFYYHQYDVWGKPYGNAPARIAAYYTRAVRAYRARDYVAASRYVGLLSHYYSDICEPFHTDQTSAERSVHGDYEEAVDELTDSVGAYRSWISYDGFQRVGSVAADAKRAAAFSHRYYSTLLGNYDRYGMNSSVRAITRVCLNRAANDLADVIRSIPGAKVSAGAMPAVPMSALANASGEIVARAPFVGSKASSKYHLPSCSWAQRIRAKNVRWFTGAQDAHAKGYVPCKICDPPSFSAARMLQQMR